MAHLNALRLLPLLALLGAPLRADVIVVDPHGGPGAAQLQSALDAAQPGDIVLIEAGDYSSVVPLVLAPGKGLVLVGDTPGIVLPGLEASDVPEGSLLLLRGLSFIPAEKTSDEPLDIRGSASVWIEDCTVLGPAGWTEDDGTLHWGQTGLHDVGPSSLGHHHATVLVRSRFVGGKGSDAVLLPNGDLAWSTSGGNGASIGGFGTLSVFDVDMSGGAAGDGVATGGKGTAGGSGLGLSALTPVVVQGGSFVGGDESPTAKGLSGPGIGGAFFDLWLRAATVAPGIVVGEGSASPALALDFQASVQELSAPARFVAIDTPVRELDPLGVHVAAQPGDIAWLFVSTQPGSLWMPSKQGMFSADPGPPMLSVYLGPVDPTGALELSSQLPTLPPGTDAALFFAQLAVIDAQGAALLGTASSLIWISASF